MATVTAGDGAVDVDVNGSIRYNPRPGGIADFTGGSVAYTYVNRVWDAFSGGEFVRWETSPAPDTLGANYPGPGTFGVDTSDYCVETVRS